MDLHVKFEQLYIVAIYALTFPVAAFISIHFYLAPTLYLIVYLGMTRFFSIITWIGIALDGFSKDSFPVSESDHEFHFSYSNPWQLLLFPVRIHGTEFDDAMRCFLKSGLKLWEARLVACLCSFGVAGDPLDDFNDDYGRSICFYTLNHQISFQLFWDVSIACVYLYYAHYLIGYGLGIVAIVEVIALGYFHYLEKVRFPKMPYFQKFYRPTIQQPEPSFWKRK